MHDVISVALSYLDWQPKIPQWFRDAEKSGIIFVSLFNPYSDPNAVCKSYMVRVQMRSRWCYSEFASDYICRLQSGDIVLVSADVFNAIFTEACDTQEPPGETD